MNSAVLDTIGRSRSSSNLGLLWTTPEIQLLNICQSDRSRPQAAIKYLAEAKRLGYPDRTKVAVEHRLQRFFRDNKINYLWTQDEDNHLIELFQEYPFEIALRKYQHWATTRNYPGRNRDPVYGRLSKLGVSVVDPVVTQNGTNPDLDSWSVLLDIPLSQLKSEWEKASNSFLRVRSPIGSVMSVTEFARQNHITANAIRKAIREGRSSVSGIRFEVCA